MSSTVVMTEESAAPIKTPKEEVTPQQSEVLQAEIVERLRRMMQPPAAPHTLADGSLVQWTTRLPRTRADGGPPREGEADGEVALHFAVHPRFGARWVTARDFEGGELMFVEDPVVYVTTLEDSAEQPLNARLVRTLLPERPKRPRAIRRLFAEHPDVFGRDDADVSMSLEWMTVYLLVRSVKPDELRPMISRMRKFGPESTAAVLQRHFERMPTLLAEFRAAMARATDKEAAPEARKAARDEAAALRVTIESAQREHADARRWITLVRRGAPGGVDTYDNAEMLTIYGTVTANALHMRTPLSELAYGMALYAGASHIAHACVASGVAVFGERGVLRVEAAGDLPAGTVVTLDRALGNEPSVRCLATAPMWMRQTYDATVGSRCFCPECIAAVTWMRAEAGGWAREEKDGKTFWVRTNDAGEEERVASDEPPLADEAAVERVVRALAAVWSDPPLDAQPLRDEFEHSLSFAMSLSRLSVAAEMIDAIGPAYLNARFAADTRTLRAAALARATVEAAARFPDFMQRRLGRETIERAAAYEAYDVEFLVSGKLREQGASDALTHRRLCALRARTRILGFAAAVAPCITEATDATSSMEEFRARVTPLLRERFAERYAELFRCIVYTAALPPLERKRLGARATAAGFERLRLEALFMRVVGVAGAVLDVNGPRPQEEAEGGGEEGGVAASE